jgi:hypothetical protein
MENTWQVCPKCNGNKFLLKPLEETVHVSPVICNICNGFGILNRDTGLPPRSNKELFIFYPPKTELNLNDKKLYDPNINLEG